MHLRQLVIANFNNYESASVVLHPKMNAFTGLNGMGKTNVLDAIYYLCLGKSYFSSTDRYVVRHGQEFFRVEGDFDTNTGIEKVEVKVNPGTKKEIIYSGKKRKKLSDHIGSLPCVIIAPADIQLMLDGSEERRKFLDNTLMQYDATYVADIITYNRLLKQRNTTYKAFADKHYYDQHLIDSISASMYEPAQRIHQLRATLAEGLSPLFEKYYSLISDEREHCTITYKSQLSLKLAQYEMLATKSDTTPILILDDIFDKLDKERVGRLLKLLTEDTFGQVCISDTNADRVPGILADMNIDYKGYQVHEGAIKEL